MNVRNKIISLIFLFLVNIMGAWAVSYSSSSDNIKEENIENNLVVSPFSNEEVFDSTNEEIHLLGNDEGMDPDTGDSGDDVPVSDTLLPLLSLIAGYGAYQLIQRKKRKIQQSI